MRRLAIAVAGLILSGCSPAFTHGVLTNLREGREVVKVCWDDGQDGSWSDASFTTPCGNVDPPTELNIVMATDQDDDIEAYRERCERMGGRELIVYLGPPSRPFYAFTEEWVCEDVDY